jgi:hypothetical protein
MSDVQTWSATAASNNSAAPNGFPEGMPPSGVNDAAREVMAAVARYRADTDGVNTSSGTNTITLAASRTMTAYAQGDMFTFKAGGTNSGATTLNVDALGAKDVQFNGAACTGGEIVSGRMYTVVYDGTQFNLINPSVISNIDINGGTIDGAVIGGSVAAAGTFTTATATTGNITAVNATTIDTTNIEVTNIKAKDGTSAGSIANATGVVTFSSSVLTTTDINGGTIDGATIGFSSAKNAIFSGTQTTGAVVRVGGTNTDTSSVTVGFEELMTLSASAVTAHSSFYSSPTVKANPLIDYYSYFANGCELAVGASVTNQYGFYSAQTMSNATNNYGFYSDLNKGLGNYYNFYANGSAPNYFAGNTIIAVADNTDAALRITQTGTANSFVVEDSSNPDSTPFVIDNAGNVIAGHTASLAVKGIGAASLTPKIEVVGNTNSLSSLGLTYYNNVGANGPQLVFAKSANTTIGSFSASASGDLLGAVAWNGVDSANADFRTACGISGLCDSVGADYTAGYIRFSTTNTSGALAERMRLTADGTLDLRQSNNGLTSDAPLNVLRFTDTDTTTAANQPIGKIEFYNSDTGNAAVGAYILSSAVGTAGGGTIRFGAAADAGAAAEIARVASTGLTVTAASAGLGYGTGSGGAVTQATNRTTGVTLDKANGAITLVSAAGSTSWQSFTVTNNTVAATDTVIVNQKSGTDLYMIHVTAVAAGSFRITFATTGGTTTEQPVFNFAVIKAVAA